jgi:hypothetical protein
MENSERETSFQYRRFPAIPRTVDSINPEKDIRVRLLGKIIDSSNGTIVIDDGSGNAEVIIEENMSASTGDLVRVFCRVLPLETGYELRAEILQPMNGFDMDLYKKIRG